jgi:ABC-2 type transport system ATP-binding protein
MVKGLQSLGKTIFLTTHYMDEAEHLADRVAIICRGEIVAEGAPAALVSADPVTTVRFRLQTEQSWLIAGITGAVLAPEGWVQVETLDPTVVLYELTRRAHDRGIELAELTVSRPSLEDTYLRLVGEGAEAAP